MAYFSRYIFCFINMLAREITAMLESKRSNRPGHFPHSFLRCKSAPSYTTLELFGCTMGSAGEIMEMSGAFRSLRESNPAHVAQCILLGGYPLSLAASYGGITSIVVHTLDRYWKIVHPIRHRKYYRQWMLKVGLFLPWISGFAVNLLPAVATSRLVNGRCFPTLFWSSELARKVRRPTFFLVLC